MSHFSKEISENGIYKNLYLYFRGTLIYKAWFVRGQKTDSRTFHAGEGRTQLLSRKFD